MRGGSGRTTLTVFQSGTWHSAGMVVTRDPPPRAAAAGACVCAGGCSAVAGLGFGLSTAEVEANGSLIGTLRYLAAVARGRIR